MASATRTHRTKHARTGRRWIALVAAAVLLSAPSLVVITVRAAPARAWEVEGCTVGIDCPGDPGGGSLGLDNGECLWDSCGDGAQSGDPDPSDQCTASSCPDGQNPPAGQCSGDVISVDDLISCPPPPQPP